MKTIHFKMLMSLMLAEKTSSNNNFHGKSKKSLINTEKMKFDEHALMLIKNRLHH